MVVVFRLIKCFLCGLLLPFMVVTFIIAHIIIPILLLVDIFKYIITGHGELTEKYLGNGYTAPIEKISFGWVDKILSRYDEIVLEDDSDIWHKEFCDETDSNLNWLDDFFEEFDSKD